MSSETNTLIYPKRSGASQGKHIDIKTNHFKIIKSPEESVYIYDVKITGKKKDGTSYDLDRKSKSNFRIQLFRELEAVLKNQISFQFIYDGASLIYSPKRFPQDEFSQEIVRTCRNNAQKTFTFHIKKCNRCIDMSDLEKFLSGQSTNADHPCSQFLDILIKQLASQRYEIIQNSFYDFSAAQDIDPTIFALSGFFQSARPSRNIMTVNLDITTKCFFKEISLLDFLRSILRRNVTETTQFYPWCLEIVNKTLHHVECYLLTDFEKQFLKFDHIDSKPCTQHFFEYEGKNISVHDYFKGIKKVNIQFRDFPVVISTRKGVFPLEYIYINRGQLCKVLNETQASRFIKMSATFPGVRVQHIERGIQQLTTSDNPYYKTFQFAIDPTMMKLSGKILLHPKILYNGSRPIIPEKGSWQGIDVRFQKPGRLDNWMIVSLCPDLNKTDGGKFLQSLSSMLVKCGLKTAKPRTINSTTNNILKDLEKNREHLLKLNLIVFILPRKSAEPYTTIKRYLETQIGLASQFVLKQNIGKNLPFYFNLALKINLKLGGYNHYVEGLKDSLPSTLVLGADVTHPGVGESSPSVACLVSSLDTDFTKFSSHLSVQPEGQEIIHSMKQMTQQAIRDYHHCQKLYPKQILLFRDGVSEGQFDKVVEEEVAAMKEAFTSINSKYRPLITVVIVVKRHHTRFFTLDNRNPPANLLVDNTIVHPSRYDFYLQSHSTCQGTVKPTHYHVLYDESNMNAKTLEAITLKFCYAYGRSTKSVSIPAPCYYADLAAGRAKTYLGTNENGERIILPFAKYLDKVLWFM